MNDEQKVYVRGVLRICFGEISNDWHFIDSMVEATIDDVCADIEVSADYDFNSDDVRIAVARVLMRKFGVD